MPIQEDPWRQRVRLPLVHNLEASSHPPLSPVYSIMKRAAEFQLTREDPRLRRRPLPPPQVVENLEEEYKMADAETLAKRSIKPLPKRVVAMVMPKPTANISSSSPFTTFNSNPVGNPAPFFAQNSAFNTFIGAPSGVGHADTNQGFGNSNPGVENPFPFDAIYGGQTSGLGSTTPAFHTGSFGNMLALTNVTSSQETHFTNPQVFTGSIEGNFSQGQPSSVLGEDVIMSLGSTNEVSAPTEPINNYIAQESQGSSFDLPNSLLLENFQTQKTPPAMTIKATTIAPVSKVNHAPVQTLSPQELELTVVNPSSSSQLELENYDKERVSLAQSHVPFEEKMTSTRAQALFEGERKASLELMNPSPLPQGAHNYIPLNTDPLGIEHSSTTGELSSQVQHTAPSYKEDTISQTPEIHSDSEKIKPGESITNSKILSPTKELQDLSRFYFIALRGLNHSFLHSTTEAMTSDPFLDFSTMMNQYKARRSAIDDKFVKLRETLIRTESSTVRDSGVANNWSVSATSQKALTSPSLEHPSEPSLTSPLSLSYPPEARVHHGTLDAYSKASPDTITATLPTPETTPPRAGITQSRHVQLSHPSSQPSEALQASGPVALSIPTVPASFEAPITLPSSSIKIGESSTLQKMGWPSILNASQSARLALPSNASDFFNSPIKGPNTFRSPKSFK